MNNHSEHDNGEARDILYLAGGAALILLGAGVAMAHPAVRRSVKAALSAVIPEFEAPLRAGMRNVLPDVERYMKMKGM